METFIHKPLSLSVLFHLGLVLVFIIVLNLKVPEKEMVEVPVMAAPIEKVQEIVKASEKPQIVIKSINESAQDGKQAREVFGASRSSYTDESLGSQGIDAKKGNTLSKDLDDTTLLDSDADSLPVPTEEYLVSEMPTVLFEVRPRYPKEAKDKELEGTVALDVLIDENGVVRQVLVIEGNTIFQDEAVRAMKNFKFSPAKIDGKAVAVRIRYSLNFVLEY